VSACILENEKWSLTGSVNELQSMGGDSNGRLCLCMAEDHKSMNAVLRLYVDSVTTP